MIFADLLSRKYMPIDQIEPIFNERIVNLLNEIEEIEIDNSTFSSNRL